MSSHTVTRIVRCRVKDLASCFFACRLPLEDERDVSSQMFDSKRSRKGHKARRKMLNDNGKSIQSLSENRSGSSGVRAAKVGGSASVEDSSSWPRFSEEDYIVFCFKDDGAIDVVNERKSSEEDSNINPRHLTMKVDEKGEMEMESEWPLLDGSKEINSREDEDQTAILPKIDSFESCDSNLSDSTSTSSFAFPVLNIEWMGSPVQMPKSEKHRARSVQLHCCRF